MNRKQIRCFWLAVALLNATVLSAQLQGPVPKLPEPLFDTPVYDQSFPVFGGYMITPGPLYYNGTSFSVKSDWKYNSYGSIYGRKAGSTYFSYMELGQYFDSRKEAYTFEDKSIDNYGGRVAYGPYRDWRLPTIQEWRVLMGTGREGAVFNGIHHVCHVTVILTGEQYAGMKNPLGLLLFPDGLVIDDTGSRLVNKNPVTYQMTQRQLERYLDNGCVFLPAAGQFFVDRLYWFFGGVNGLYQTSQGYTEQMAAALQFGSHEPKVVGALKVYHFFMTRLVRKVTPGEITSSAPTPAGR